MKLGKCPYCNGNIERRKINSSKKVFIYACSNAHWEFDNDIWVSTQDSSCTFKFFSNALARWNKFYISEQEVKELLKNGIVKITLVKNIFKFKNNKKVCEKLEYQKDLITNQEYGVEVLW